MSQALRCPWNTILHVLARLFLVAAPIHVLRGTENKFEMENENEIWVLSAVIAKWLGSIVVHGACALTVPVVIVKCQLLCDIFTNNKCARPLSENMPNIA